MTQLKTLTGDSIEQRLGKIQGELALIDYILNPDKLEKELKENTKDE